MDLFHQIPDGQAILFSRGNYKQVDLYRRGDRVFVKNGGGFARIEAKSGSMWGTSLPSLMVVEFESHLNIGTNRHGAPTWGGR